MERKRERRSRPSYPDDGPGFDLGVFRGDCLDIGGDLGGDAGGRILAEELAELLLLLRGVRRELGDGEGLAGEPVGDEDAVLLGVVRGREDVGTLQRLREVPEDVVDADDALGGVGGARRVFIF